MAEILERIRPLQHKDCVSLRFARGRVLAADVHSDVDLPPFEKSSMDGFAVHSADFADARGPVELGVVGESRAGLPFEGPVARGRCVAIYTGAELPPDCDAVVVVEETERMGERVRVAGRARPGANVCHRGEVLARGDLALSPGRRLSPADLAVLAAVGADPVTVHPQPRVSVLTTGDELVPVNAQPGRGQIREGNTLYLAAACERAGCLVIDVGIVRDDPDELFARLGAALESSDALITTGGVSVGKYDLVGAAFERLGVEPVLHKVSIKPGKPIWFGLRGDTPVFGLPGNPVSSLLGFEVFVRPALARLGGAGVEEQREVLRQGIWNGPATESNARQQNLPALVRQGDDGRDHVEPIRWLGSADIVGASRASAFAVVPPQTVVETGEPILYRPLA